MNADRRFTGQVIVHLLLECAQTGFIGDEAHLTVTTALQHMKTSEHWQLQNQQKHEGKNATTDLQIAICRVALPALEAAWDAWNEDDFDTTIAQLSLAVTTDGKISKKGLRSTRKSAKLKS